MDTSITNKELVELINSLRATNSIKKKVSILSEHNSDVVKLLFDLTYNTTVHTFNVTLPSVEYYTNDDPKLGLTEVLAWMYCNDINHADITDVVRTFLENMSPDEASLLLDVVHRDLRVKMSLTSINKALGNIIPSTRNTRKRRSSCFA